jgi:hypothetical protein
MALTKISRGLLDTGVSDSSDATAITIDSSERVQIGSTGITSTIDSSFHAHQSVDGDAIYYLFNDTQSSSSSTNETTQLYLGWRDAATGIAVAPRIVAGKEGDFTTAGNADSFLAFHTSADNTLGEKVRITSTGYVGIGTSSPSKLFSISGGDFSFNAGTGNLGNRYMVINAGTSNDGGFILQRDNTNQWQIVNGTSDGDLILYSYGTSSTILTADRSTGNLGIGSLGTDGQHRLKLTAGTGGARCLNMGTVNSGLCATTNNVSGTANYDAFAFTTSGGSTQVGGIVVGGSSTAYNTTSDYRLKENVDYTWDATTRLKQLRPARFNWISDSTDTLVDGFLAHEVEDIVPEAITGTKDATETLSNVVRSAQGMVLAEGITEAEWTTGKANAVLWTEEDELPEGVSVGDVKNEATYPSDSTWDASLTKDVYQNIDQAKLVPLLVKTIQELEARITTLENA